MHPPVPHARIPAASLAARDAYRIMTGLVVPRPIAWISTLDETGRGNLAPFSYFQAACSRPPMVTLSLGWRGDGRPKDTLRNILARREFTINHVSEDLAEPMHRSAADLPPDRSEWELTGLAPAPSAVVAPPRVARALASLECRMTHAIPLGSGRGGGPSVTLVVAEVLEFWVEEGALRRDQDGRPVGVDPERLASVGRMGGADYVRTRERFEVPEREEGDT